MWRAIGFLLLLVGVGISGVPAFAQTGFNPEFLGNGGPGPYQSFCLKYFNSYFHQEGPSAHDAELALEPQFFTEGFTGEARNDQLLFLLHAPVGYRSEVSSGERQSGAGLGTVSSNIHHFWRLSESEELPVWFDNGLSVGFPTATESNGVRLGGNAFSVGWYEEFFLKGERWMASVVPFSLSWGFRDYRTDERGGLSLGLINSSLGRRMSSRTHLGLNSGLAMGRIVGGEDGSGNSLATTWRAYAGPSASVSIRKDLFLQVGSAIDLVTRGGLDRGQGIFVALWHNIF